LIFFLIFLPGGLDSLFVKLRDRLAQREGKGESIPEGS